jgi:Fe-S cluster assembly protein SufD
MEMESLRQTCPQRFEMAVELIEEVNSYGAAFRHLLNRSNRSEPLWLTQRREAAFEHFERVGFPTVREEDWKYTNVSPIARTHFTPIIENIAGQRLNENTRAFFYDEARDSRLVFLNGIFQPGLSAVVDLPNGVVIAEFAEVLRQPEYEARFREHLNSNSEANAFTALNQALFTSGALVLIPRKVEVTVPIHLLFISQAQNGDAPASFPRVMVIAEENSSATIIENYVGLGRGVYFTNTVLGVVVESGARLQHYKVQRENASAFHIATTSVVTERDSRYDSTTINLGAALARHNITVSFNEERGECAVDGLYMIGTDQHTDTHSLIDHRQAHCTSRQLYKGVLDGKSHAVFNGKVFVRHGAQQTDAQQTNKNLLLSNEARVDTKPQLEIFADDVKCAHGAAVGQLSEEELFYLESRGINPMLARNLLTYGFAEEVIEKIKIASIKKELDEVVLNRLHTAL